MKTSRVRKETKNKYGTSGTAKPKMLQRSVQNTQYTDKEARHHWTVQMAIHTRRVMWQQKRQLNLTSCSNESRKKPFGSEAR